MSIQNSRGNIHGSRVSLQGYRVKQTPCLKLSFSSSMVNLHGSRSAGGASTVPLGAFICRVSIYGSRMSLYSSRVSLCCSRLSLLGSRVNLHGSRVSFQRSRVILGALDKTLYSDNRDSPKI
jgi:hypothetical protein